MFACFRDGQPRCCLCARHQANSASQASHVTSLRGRNGWTLVCEPHMNHRKTIGNIWKKHRKTIRNRLEIGGLMGLYGIYPLVMTVIVRYWTWSLKLWASYTKWWFSVVMLVCQRVYPTDREYSSGIWLSPDQVRSLQWFNMLTLNNTLPSLYL